MTLKSPKSSTLSDLLEKLARAFQAEKIPYMLIGGQAVLAYGEPRLTRDIDVTIGLAPEGLPRILKLLKKLELSPLPKDPRKFVEKTMVLPAGHAQTGARVDIIFSISPYESQALKRARKIQVHTHKVCFAAAEDVIIHKIVAGRPRDLEDAQGILLKQKKMDLKYIRSWLGRFDQALSSRYLDLFDSLIK